jgi:hypothetical protein
LVGIASISLTADGLMKRLYPATPPEILDDVLEGKVGLRLAQLESGQILGKTCLDGT